MYFGLYEMLVLVDDHIYSNWLRSQVYVTTQMGACIRDEVTVIDQQLQNNMMMNSKKGLKEISWWVFHETEFVIKGATCFTTTGDGILRVASYCLFHRFESRENGDGGAMFIFSQFIC